MVSARNEFAWLPDFALFMACKDEYGGGAWNTWPHDSGGRTRRRMTPRETAVRKTKCKSAKYWQFEFFRQWQALRGTPPDWAYALLAIFRSTLLSTALTCGRTASIFSNADGRALKGVRSSAGLFQRDRAMWGNPIYDWGKLRQTGYRWWIERFRAALALYDAVRIDHFRGFEAYWEISAQEKTALHGQWVKGPGAELFARCSSANSEVCQSLPKTWV